MSILYVTGFASVKRGTGNYVHMGKSVVEERKGRQFQTIAKSRRVI